MAKVKYDVRGVESGGGTPLAPGVYNAKITQADVTKPEGKDQRIEVIFEIVNSEKENNGKKLYEYINLESENTKWKLREYLEALGMATEQGEFDTDDHLNLVIGVKTIVRPADEARGFDARASVRRMFALDEKVRNGASAPKEVLDPPDVPVAEEDEGEELTWEELNGMSRAELKELNKVEEAGIKVTKSLTDDDLRARLAEFFELPPLVEEAEEEDEEEEDEEPEAEAEEAAEDAGDDDDYDEWSEADLKEELSQRSLSTKGSKKVLIGRLRRDDNAEDKPF
jgi:SAP domain